MLKTVKDGEVTLQKITQTDSVEHRARNAEVCVTALKLSMPTVIDKEDNQANIAYAGGPDRMVVVGTASRIAHMGGPGPGGFKPQEVEQWLKKHLD